METMENREEFYRRLFEKMDQIDKKIEERKMLKQLSEIWLDIQEVCLLLKISKRTLQSYRDNGILPFSQIGGKIYFRASDIESHLNRHYIKALNSKK